MQIAGYLLSTVVQIQIFSFCLAQRPIGDRCFTPRGLKGSCQLRSNCPKAQEDIRNGIRQYICGFQGRNPILCCPEAVSKALKSVAPYETADERELDLVPEDRCVAAGGINGVCKSMRICSRAQEDIQNGIEPIYCGIRGGNPIVCCPEAKSQALKSRVPYETAEKWCERYNSICPNAHAVVGGYPTYPGEIPHMVAIGYGEETNIAWNCGGSLISEKFILTAAHCLSSREFGPARWVLLGTINLINTTATDGKKGQIHPITRRIPHPEYKPPAKYNDIALFEIGPAVTPNPRPLNLKDLHPACLNTKNPYPIPRFTVLAPGWGKVGQSVSGSSNLLQVQLTTLELSFCQKAFEVEIRSTNKLKKGIVNTMLCAGVLAGKKDTCKGDSGGPLQIASIYKCKYKIFGVTSFGKVCGFPNSPSIYTNVYEYIPWIEDIVWPE